MSAETLHVASGSISVETIKTSCIRDPLVFTGALYGRIILYECSEKSHGCHRGDDSWWFHSTKPFANASSWWILQTPITLYRVTAVPSLVLSLGAIDSDPRRCILSKNWKEIVDVADNFYQ